jgi:predicted phosphodiesterase
VSKDRQHEFISELKRVALELGRTPTRDEFHELSKLPRREQDRLFGGFTFMVHAAGLEVNRESSSKIRREQIKNSFVRNLADDLKKGMPLPRKLNIQDDFCIVVLGDTHFPWVNHDALMWAYAMIEKLKPDVVIQAGDLMDSFSWSKFPKTKCIYNPQEELNAAFTGATEMWKSIKRIVPAARCIQIAGNHDPSSRVMRQVMSQAPELEPFIDIKKWFTFDGVESVYDPREVLLINGIEITHGHRLKHGDYMKEVQRCVVLGHLHVGNVAYKKLISGRVIWELNAGYLGDPKSIPLSYTPKNIDHWINGIGVIDSCGPRFIAAPSSA